MDALLKFNCEPCSYSSDDKSNYERHINTQKHLIKIKEYKRQQIELNSKFVCDKCDRIFANISGLSRHRKICNNEAFEKFKDDYEKKLVEKESEFQIKLLETERECDKKIMERDLKYQKELEKKLLKQEIKFDNELKAYKIEVKAYKIELKEAYGKIEQLNEKLQQQTDQKAAVLSVENNYHKNMFEHAGTVVKTSVNALSYVAKHYNNAPAIQEFSDFKLLNKEENYTLSEVIIYYYKCDSLGRFLGEIVIEIYQKKDRSQQSLWNTDASRFGYIIREFANDKVEWAIDKGAIKVKKYTIKPMMEKIKKDLNEFIVSRSILLKDPKADFVKIQGEINVAYSIIKEIDNGTLEDEIIKYITPSFHLNKTKAIMN